MKTTVITAAILAAATFASAASAETLCAIDDASVYFENGKSGITQQAQDVVTRVATEARKCRADAVIVRASSGDLGAERAQAITNELNRLGVNAAMVGAPRSQPQTRETFIANRATQIEIRASARSVS